ncbi:platelet glycoprotein Ib alpha chain [Candoia aspera]|uniref:platelet glycoprotein Ib alpha chain n=1 Tax=Candoia aspera TaxID=51853 RepID=UPI002FD7CFAB
MLCTLRLEVLLLGCSYLKGNPQSPGPLQRQSLEFTHLLVGLEGWLQQQLAGGRGTKGGLENQPGSSSPGLHLGGQIKPHPSTPPTPPLAAGLYLASVGRAGRHIHTTLVAKMGQAEKDHHPCGQGAEAPGSCSLATEPGLPLLRSLPAGLPALRHAIPLEGPLTPGDFPQRTLKRRGGGAPQPSQHHLSRSLGLECSQCASQEHQSKMLQGLLAPLLLVLFAAVAAAMPPPEHCESEMNKIKDLLQVSCVGKGLTIIPTGLPKDTGILLLSSNRLAQVTTAFFQHLQQLSELDLSNNSLEALDTSTPLPNLQQLLLSHNGLESLPAFPGLPSLKRLALGHNNISQLPKGGFRGLGQLRDLELQGNRLQSLPSGAFQGLRELRDLDLSENLLEALPPDLLAELPNLEILRLERNRLRHVPDGFFSEEALYAYVYLAENPWRCDCQLVYLRDWILENEISVYTRTSVQEQGSEKVVTENEPGSVQCHEPPKEKGQPVMHFQAACRKLGDEEKMEDGEHTADDPGTLAPTPPSLKPTTGVPPSTLLPAPSSLSHSPITAITPTGASPTTTSTSTFSSTPTSHVPSTAVNVPTTITMATFTLSTTGVIVERPTATSSVPTPGSSTTPPPTAPPKTSSVPTAATATSPTAFAHRSTAPMRTAPVPQSTLPPARTVARRPPSTLALVPSTAPVRTSPRISASISTRYPSPPPSSKPAVHCLCPALPVRVLGVATHKGSPANWPAGYCCLLRLILYVVCLALVALPTLAVLCWLGWAYLSWYQPALQGAPGARLVGNQQWQKVTPKEWRLKTAEAPSPMAGPQIYHVCKKFRIGPSRHVTWLLISLPGSASEWPWGRGQDRLSSYSLDRGRDTIGAVRVKYAADSL